MFTKEMVGRKVHSLKHGLGIIAEYREGVIPWRLVVNFGGELTEDGWLGGKMVLYIEDGRLTKDHYNTQDLFLIE